MNTSDWYMLFREGISLPIEYLLSPSRRIFIGYLAASGLIAFCLLHFGWRYSAGKSLRCLFSRRCWWSASSRVDYGLFLLGLLFKFFFIIPYLSVGTMLAWGLSNCMTDVFGSFHHPFSPSVIAMTYPIILFLVKDFAVFLTHYCLHRNPYLWEFHKVHHSATNLNPFTLYRMHPIEILLQNLQGITAYVLVTGIFFYFNDSVVARATIWGVNAFSFLFFVAGANLRHSEIPLRYPRLIEKWLMSPFQHQIHHGNRPEQCHRNFGSRLSVWDRCFGTLVYSSQVVPSRLRFGLPGKGLHCANTLKGNLMSPFIGCLHRLQR